MASRNWRSTRHNEDEGDNSIVETGLKKLYASKKYLDCKFLVGRNKVPLEAHRLVLAMASDAFEELLYSHTLDEPILVPEIDPFVFKIILRYIYLNDSPFEDLEGGLMEINDITIDLWYATCKYGLQKLNKECYNKIKLNIASWLHVYFRSKILLEDGHQGSDVKTLLSRSLKLLSVKTLESLCASEEYKFMARFLKELFALDHMNIDREIDLFRVLVKFASKHGWKPDTQYLLEKDENGVELLTPFQKDIRETMKQIRFLRITLKAFDSISKSGFFTEFEVETIRNRIADENSPCVSIAGFSKNTAERYKLIHIGSTKIIQQNDKNKDIEKLEFSIEFPSTTLAVTEPVTVGSATFRVLIYQRENSRREREYTVYLKCVVPETKGWKCYAQLDMKIVLKGDRFKFENIPWYCFKCDANYSQTKPFKVECPVEICHIVLAVSPHHMSYKNKMSNVTATYGEDLHDFV